MGVIFFKKKETNTEREGKKKWERKKNKKEPFCNLRSNSSINDLSNQSFFLGGAGGGGSPSIFIIIITVTVIINHI